MVVWVVLVTAAASAAPVWWLLDQPWSWPLRLTAILAAWQVLLGLATAVTYLIDKRRAQRDAWRVPERQLHSLALAGGWAGAWFGRQRFRHKTQKPIFAWVIGAGAVLWLALTAGLWWLPGLMPASNG